MVTDRGPGLDPERGPSDDAVRPDPDASYERALEAPVMDQREEAVLSAQLGRPSRAPSAAVHRCVFGLPTVARVAPRLRDGTPFPTVFWLSCPVLSSRVGTLEGSGVMVELNQRLDGDDAFQAEHAAAQERYRRFRDEVGGGEGLPGDPYAGGDPNYVKCLHVHVAHTLATGDGPVGRVALDEALPAPCEGPCVSDEDVDEWQAKLEAGDEGTPTRRRG